MSERRHNPEGNNLNNYCLEKTQTFYMHENFYITSHGSNISLFQYPKHIFQFHDVIPAPSSESWCLVCCKCEEDCWTCVFNETIYCGRYVQAIVGQFFPQLIEKERLYGWFQQDSATAHTARMSMQALSDAFGTELSAVVFGQHFRPILILVTLSGVVWRRKFTTITPERKK
jgi:hypothetical protein